MRDQYAPSYRCSLPCDIVTVSRDTSTATRDYRNVRLSRRMMYRLILNVHKILPCIQ